MPKKKKYDYDSYTTFKILTCHVSVYTTSWACIRTSTNSQNILLSTRLRSRNFANSFREWTSKACLECVSRRSFCRSPSVENWSSPIKLVVDWGTLAWLCNELAWRKSQEEGERKGIMCVPVVCVCMFWEKFFENTDVSPFGFFREAEWRNVSISKKLCLRERREGGGGQRERERERERERDRERQRER